MIERVLSVYYKDSITQSIMRAQSVHRLKLVDFWGIKEGDRVLEIGCGQGDTTVALGFAVGENGYVHALDAADESYGAPETIGKARKRIMNSELTKRVKMTFECDIMNDDITFSEDEFDVAVLSHCLWYFKDYEVLEEILKKIRKCAKRICIAEWNPLIISTEQLAHLQAAEVQSVCESFSEESDTNIRTMFYPDDIRAAVLAAGYRITDSTSIFSEDIYDAKWELDITLSAYPRKISKMQDMPERLKEQLLSKIQSLRKATDVKPMSSYVLCAERIDD